MASFEKKLIYRQGKWLQKSRVFHVVYHSLIIGMLQVRYTAQTVPHNTNTGQTGSEMWYNTHVLF